MTAQRHWRPPLAFIALLAGLSLAAMATAARASTTERVVVDRTTGLALGGFDPVAYFTDAHPVAGRAGFEAFEAGAFWRFHNEGNRASFLAHPEIYGPQFGGYDPTGVARGVAVAGDPRFWLILRQRLFLYSAAQSRDAYAADPAALLRQARQRWPGVKETLAR